MTPQTGPEAAQSDETAWDIVAALGERLLHASGDLMDLELTASNEGSWKRAMRLKAKRAGVELALSYLNEELRLRGVLS